MKKILLILTLLSLSFTTTVFAQRDLDKGSGDDTALRMLRLSLEYKKDAEYKDAIESSYYGFYRMFYGAITWGGSSNGGDPDGFVVEHGASSSISWGATNFPVLQALWLETRAKYQSLPQTSYNKGLLAAVDAAFSDAVIGGGAL